MFTKVYINLPYSLVDSLLYTDIPLLYPYYECTVIVKGPRAAVASVVRAAKLASETAPPGDGTASNLDDPLATTGDAAKSINIWSAIAAVIAAEAK